MASEPTRTHPLLSLDEGDLEFVLRLVLASGSLKEMAQLYRVSYPTIRAKLDRVILHLQKVVEGRPVDLFADLLGNLVEKGELSSSSARSILDLHRKELKKKEN